jgi:prolyl oligopeptidase
MQSLRNDINNYAKTEAEFLSFVREIAKRADAQIPKFFKNLPRCPYGVEAMSLEEAPNGPAAQYITPNSDCTRPGVYQVNTFNLNSRPKYLYESTTLHEGVPGHHLQLAISTELTNVPEFRKYLDFTAFIEGWALCKFTN